MTRHQHGRSHHPSSNSLDSQSQRPASPGKRTLTAQLTPRPGARAVPVQRRQDPAATPSPAAPAEDWTRVAFRPDLHAEPEPGAPAQRKDSAHAAPTAAAPAATSGGSKLPAPVQARMEHAFGTDFSAVRVHEGQEAGSLGALAYTQGTDIHFAPGQYQPGSEQGQKLLGHELTHVVQQAQGRVRATTQAKGVAVNDEPALEREADRLGEKAARGEVIGMQGKTGASDSNAPVQRYSRIGGNRYTMNGAAGDTMFESQAIDRTGGNHRYVRTTKDQRADGRLDVQDQHYDTVANAWQNAGAVRQENLPPLNISDNGLLAIERTNAQPRGFYIENALLTAVNDDLRDNTTGVIRLLPTGASINVPALHGHPWAAHDLDYVTLTTTDVGTDAALGAPDLTRIAHHACDTFTAHIKGGNVQGGGATLDRAAQPVLGENYHIHETGALYQDSHGNMRNYSVQKPGVGKDELHKMLIELDKLEQVIEEKGISATEKWFYKNNVRALLDTWGDHYEGVIAVDGADRITAVNYNRNTEARWERRRVFREYYRTVKAFRQAVRTHINAAHGGHQITWQQYRNLADQQTVALLNALGGAHANVATELTDLQTTVDDEALTMWYFCMYGTGRQSFHSKFAPGFWTPETKIA